MNQLCFEGGMFSRRVVETIGLPDFRYFIYGDDAVYGYLASKHFPAAVVADVVLRRARVVSNWDIAGKRQLNSTSDNNRYYIMRNRASPLAICAYAVTTIACCTAWAPLRPLPRSSFALSPSTAPSRRAFRHSCAACAMPARSCATATGNPCPHSADNTTRNEYQAFAGTRTSP